MLTSLVVAFVLSLTITDGQVLLYNTENNEAVEKFDCAYYVPSFEEEVSYCRRPSRIQSLNRHKNECDNQGKKNTFRYLLKYKIHPSTILKWSSSVEIADLYANAFYNPSLIDDDDDRFICNCSELGTFGRYCEYQLTHNAKMLSQTLAQQFKQKESGDSWNTQRYGKILCYETLFCPSRSLCLDWREICDGNQRCSNGIDEENCDRLEFNECEPDEFRCTNGMCIAEDFWLDGSYDCMDWSDEYQLNIGELCPFEPNAIECDEHLCLADTYSCGDRECVLWETRMAFQRFVKADSDCFNKRNLNYMCEVSPHQPAWTLESGLCWPDKGYDDPRYPPWNMINTSKLTIDEKCEYLLRCVLSEDLEHDCSCNHRNCTQMMTNICPRHDHGIIYPAIGLIDPNFFVMYNYSHSVELPTSQSFLLSGGLKCRGYFFQTKILFSMPININIIRYPRNYNILCTINDPNYGSRDFSSSRGNNKFCWNDSSTFNGRPYAVNPDVCTAYGECISQYRIHDGRPDCLDGHDELISLDKNLCTENVGRHRFQCFNDQHKCIPVHRLGITSDACLNNYDKSLYGTGTDLRLQLSCFKEVKTDCHLVKAYVQQSSIRNSSNNASLINPQIQQKPTDRMPFRYYCDTLWNLERHVDEISSSCQYWVCLTNQYQCQTGQCIDLEWVCDGEWDCSDASDEEAILLIKKWSDHNAHLLNLSSQREKCRQRYSKSPFSNICNTSFEFGCYLSGVENPLDIQKNRPCINLTQIGDDKEDCYNAFDEKNTFTANASVGGMWGFHFRCGNDHHSGYEFACIQQHNYTNILCSRVRDKDGSCSDIKDFICLKDDHCKKNARCDGKFDCFYGEDEYWCPSGTLLNQMTYRFHKIANFKSMDESSLQIFYPPEDMLKINQHQLSTSVANPRNDQLFKVYSYQCNRGMAIIEMNETRCLCPPAYYGDWCQFFSDRISIIAHVDQRTMPKTISHVTLKIKANFLLNNQIIDYHEFHVVPVVERDQSIKHKFYLLYSRSIETLAHKQRRYFDRSDIINNHPYSVHFDIFTLEKNNSVGEIGSWHYPIYFDYLPAFRLAVVLKFPSWLKNATLDPCRQNSCGENSICLPVFNRNHSYYCSCKNGYYGINCSMYESLCETYCSVNAFCRPDHSDIHAMKNKPYCICPLSHFGPRCNLKYDGCTSNSCLNNGTCFLYYEPSVEHTHICQCPERFYGSRCEYEKASVYIDLNMTKTLSIRAVVVQFYSPISISFALAIEHQQLYNDLPSSVKYYQSTFRAPSLGILKIFEDLSHSQYFFIYFLHQSKINITSSPRHCPHVSLLLFEDIDPSVAPVFKYHHICQNDTERLCFYDENYFCICQQDHNRAECFLNDIQHDRCYECLSGGKCVQGGLNDPNDFICLCPFCYRGHRCEFSLQAFGFTLDSLLVECSKKVKIVYVYIVAFLFLIGLFNNFCSFITFKRRTPRKFGVGNYLLTVSCLNQIALFCLLFKFIQITIGFIDIGSCKAISYLLSVMTRSTYWLTSWITVDRLLMIVFPTSSALKNPRLAIAVSVITLIILCGMHVHEIIYYTIIEDFFTGSSICVTKFDISLVSSYNRISTLIHYLCPFFIQIICITFLIVLAARSRAKTIGQKATFGEVLKKQFETQKELYVTPTIIVLSSLPQAILTFSFACTQLNDWRRHTLLSSYLLSYAPQILGFILYVLPSTLYKREFSQTFIGKNSSKLISSTKRSGPRL